MGKKSLLELLRAVDMLYDDCTAQRERIDDLIDRVEKLEIELKKLDINRLKLTIRQ